MTPNQASTSVTSDHASYHALDQFDAMHNSTSIQVAASPDSSPAHHKFKSIIVLTYGTNRHPLPHDLTVALYDPLSFEPTSYTQASKHPYWQQAMKEKYEALIQNHTWSLILATPNMNITGCKWVFRVKRKADGYIDRQKACLVTKGYNQQEGLDYHDTLSPVAKPGTIRTILALTVSKLALPTTRCA